MDVSGVQNNFKPTGVTKKVYLDIIEKVFDSYGVASIEKFLELPDAIYHFTAFRTSVMIAYLVSSGRRPELLELWQRVTEKSVRALSNTEESPFRDNGYNDMTLEELCISFMLMKEYVKPEWLEALRNAKPETHYGYLTKDMTHSMMTYGLVGMYLRYKLTDESCDEYFDLIMPWVIECFDENGMYEDPDRSLLYDLTPRIRFEQLLWFGYDGKWAKEIDEKLRLGGEMSLKMQSATFQIPYGGRSNQFLHNEALQASLFEYEANRHKRLGDLQKAGQFKRAAHLSALTVLKYLELPDGAKHIRNKFPQDSLYGIDYYGTFPRYMNALAAFIACGYLAADDDIEECICPAEAGGYVIKTSDRFGKVFASAAGQSVEYAVLADPVHEVPGLGRYHASGIPSELGLSMPFVEKPIYLLSQNCVSFDILGPNPIVGEYAKYATDTVSSINTAISPGYTDASGERHFLFENEAPKGVEILEESQSRVSFRVIWESAIETVTVDKNGVHVSCKLKEGFRRKVFWSLPLLSSNGKDKTLIKTRSNEITVHYDNCENKITSDASLSLSDTECGNRNGIYRIAYADSDTDSCTVTIKLSRTGG